MTRQQVNRKPSTVPPALITLPYRPKASSGQSCLLDAPPTFSTVSPARSSSNPSSSETSPPPSARPQLPALLLNAGGSPPRCDVSLSSSSRPRSPRTASGSSAKSTSSTPGGANGGTSSSSLLTTDTLQAHYNFYQQSHQHHHSTGTSASICEGGLACHSPGSCATCDNNVVPHFHTYVPDVPDYIFDAPLSTAWSLPHSHYTSPVCPNGDTSQPSSNLSSPLPSPRSQSAADVDNCSPSANPFLLDPLASTSVSRSSSTCSLVNKHSSEASTHFTGEESPCGSPISGVGLPVEEYDDDSSPRFAASSVKNWLHVFTNPFGHTKDALQSPRDSPSGGSSAPTSPRGGGQVVASSGTHYADSSGGHSLRREAMTRTTVELLSYRVRVAIDKSLYRINELRELERRVIAIAVDDSIASRQCLGWCRKHLIRQDSDIVVVISAWEEFNKSQQPSVAALSTPNNASGDSHIRLKEEAAAHNKHAVVRCKRMLGHYYKEYLVGCDVYPLLLPVDKTSCMTPVNDYDGESGPTDSQPASVISRSHHGEVSSGGNASPGGSQRSHRQPRKSAIASVLCRAMKILRADHLILGCRHAHTYSETHTTHHSDPVMQKEDQCGVARTSICKQTESNSPSHQADKAASGKGKHGAEQAQSSCGSTKDSAPYGYSERFSERMKTGMSSASQQPPSNTRKHPKYYDSGTSVVEGSTYSSPSDVSVPMMRQSPSTPSLMNYHKYLSDGGTNAACVIRRLFRGSVSHYVLKNTPPTCTVVLVRSHKSCRGISYTVTSTSVAVTATGIVASSGQQSAGGATSKEAGSGEIGTGQNPPLGSSKSRTKQNLVVKPSS